jgi:hypothetical protein
MSYNLITFQTFDQQVKRLSKYTSLKHQLFLLGQSLMENPVQGVSLKMNCFKIRLQFRAKEKVKTAVHESSHMYIFRRTR